MQAQRVLPSQRTWPTWSDWACGEMVRHLTSRINFLVKIHKNLIYKLSYFKILNKSFNDFIQSIEKRGIGAMEIVAMDMKLRGMYMARQLSFSGVSFKVEEIKLKEEYIKMYDDAVRLVSKQKEFSLRLQK